jgi:hypothetical protein
MSGNTVVQAQYLDYQQRLSKINHTYDPLIEHFYQDLMNAYSAAVATDGFYLRDVDLQVLADTKNKQLNLYRKSDLHTRQYVVQPYGVANGELVEIYHQGAHYEQAHLAT